VLSLFSVDSFHFVVFFFTNGQVIVSFKSYIFSSEEPNFCPLFCTYNNICTSYQCLIVEVHIIFLENAVDIIFTTNIFIFVCFLTSHLCMLDDSVLERDHLCFLQTLNI